MLNRINGMVPVAEVRAEEDHVAMAYRQLATHLEKVSNNHWETGQLFERLHEMGQSDAQIAEHADMSPQNVFKIRKTSLAFLYRQRNVDKKSLASFSHHIAALGWDDAEKWLELAEKRKLSVREMVAARDTAAVGTLVVEAEGSADEWHDVEQPEAPAVDAAMAEEEEGTSDPELWTPIDPVERAILNAPLVASFRDSLTRFARDLKAIEPTTPGLEKLAKARRRILRAIDDLKAAVSCSIPCCRCTRCNGERCQYCDNLGWIDTHTKTEWANHR